MVSLTWPIIYAISAVDLLVTVRWGLRDAPLLPETKPRLAASACALLIMCALLLCSPLAAACCFGAYLAADLVVCGIYGPPLPLSMQAHHALSIVMTAAGAREMVAGSGGSRAAAEACTAALLWMEAVNPILHLSWYVTKEPGPAAATPKLVKALLAAALLVSYGWLRVLGCARVAWDLWGKHWDVLGAPAPFYFALVVALGTMQATWWVALARLVGKELAKPAPPPSPPPASGAPPPAPPAADEDEAEKPGSVLVKPHVKRRSRAHHAT